jgi:hypothetical protein
MMMSFVAPGKTRSTSESQRSAPFGILPPRTSGKSLSFIALFRPNELAGGEEELAPQRRRRPLIRCGR